MKRNSGTIYPWFRGYRDICHKTIEMNEELYKRFGYEKPLKDTSSSSKEVGDINERE